MTDIRKKHLKIKKKNSTIFLTCIVLIIISIIYGINIINNKQLTNKENKLQKKDNTPTIKEEDTSFEKASKLSYYRKENDTRYRAYRKLNPSLTTEQIVTEVNIGLDNPYYTNDILVENLNSQYILVNKYNYLSKDYIPADLQEISSQYSAKNMLYLVSYAKDAFEEMAKAAKQENLTVLAMSTYRSYDYQEQLYNNYVKQDGKENADTYSARPGYSEHQTGLAVDVCNGKESYTNFEVTQEFIWMQENAYKFGFILRFPKDKVRETGYSYESWHYRYVGKEIAEFIHNHNITYEEYYVQNIQK